jgi:hypothetical protein
VLHAQPISSSLDWPLWRRVCIMLGSPVKRFFLSIGHMCSPKHRVYKCPYGAHTRSIMLRNISCCATWLFVYGADWLDREWTNLCCAKQFCATWLIVYGPHYSTKSVIFGDVTLNSPTEVHWRFGGTHCFHLQSRRVSKARNRARNKQNYSACCWFPAYSLTPKMATVSSSEKSINLYHNTRLDNPEDSGDSSYAQTWESKIWHTV